MKPTEAAKTSRTWFMRNLKDRGVKCVELFLSKKSLGLAYGYRGGVFRRSGVGNSAVGG